ncbi:MAG: RNA 3'-terminal phosphate cyclase [Candidatus Thermoplasmatota archaeon]|nr:RNA 3'-terminal phosphate cyclase [Candidatus Thermoplasmatota archaeon]
MLVIDGSYGEGGGQIIRTAVALSVLTKQPIEITNIRAGRPNPGLRPQHYTALLCIRDICDAEVQGLSVHSTHLIFKSHNIKPGKYTFDIGTAGSMILVFQACLLSAFHTPAPLTITLRGGTDVRWAPSWDYFASVFLPLISKMGIKTEIKLIKRGYYPTGGGEATLTIHPVDTILPFVVDEPQTFTDMAGIVHRANLPDHISTRMKHAAIKTAIRQNLRANIQIDAASSSSSGTGITVWSTSDSTILGSTVLGEKAIPAEAVGEMAANQLVQEIRSGATIDRHAFDQVLPYFVLGPKESVCLIREMSNHAKTNMWLIKHFFNVDFEVTSQQHTLRLRVK